MPIANSGDGSSRRRKQPQPVCNDLLVRRGMGASLLIWRLAGWATAVGRGRGVARSILFCFGGSRLARKAAYLNPMIVVRFELFRVCALGPRVVGANMQCKLFVALQLEVAHHLIERYAAGRTRRFEAPATFGATKPPKTLLVNPHQFAAHGLLCRCAPSPSDPRAWYPLAGKGRNVLVRHNVSFRSDILPDCSRSLWAQRKMRERETGEVYICQFGWSVGHPTYLEDFLFVRTPSSASFEVRGIARLLVSRFVGSRAYLY
jgi:hypothetical protein